MPTIELFQTAWDAFAATRDFFNHNVLFGVGVLLLASFFAGKLAQRLSLPSVTGYIVAGLFLGPHMLKFVGDTEKVTQQLEPIPHIALGLIALTIGSRFSISEVRRLGRPVAVVTLSQLIATFVLVAGALWAFGMDLDAALLLGAIASATAPAATMAVINEYRARGPMTDTLVATIALDDFGAIVLFSFAFAVARMLLGDANGILMSIVSGPLYEIVGSVVVGVCEGVLTHRLVRGRRNDNEVRIIVIGALLFTSAVTMEAHLSPLITNMAMGFAMINLAPQNARKLRLLEPLEAPIYATFFALAGTELNPAALHTIGWFGTVYIVARLIGKYAGAYLGARAAHMPSMTQRLLGICLFPQAGVAIGLVVASREMIKTAGLAALGTDLGRMVSIVIASVLVNELIGPPLVKYAIFKSGEVTKPDKAMEGGQSP